jgi:diguanylate cyclase (GGDEF)-like protein
MLMLERSRNGFAPLLTALFHVVLEAETPDEVREAIAHAAGLICPWDTLTLRESTAAGALDVTLRGGEELDANAKALDRQLAHEAALRGRTISTIDRFTDASLGALARGYVRRYGLCLSRPLFAYGKQVGVLTLHYGDMTALGDDEFGALRRLADGAGVALSNAQARHDLRELAYTDALTGLASRRWLELELSRLANTSLSLLLIDFDGLKAVNDRLGYDRGDELIVLVSAVLAQSMRDGERAARLGGDEFVVVIPDGDAIRARQRAEELMVALDRVALPEDVEQLFQGASVGPATADEGEDPRIVLQRASTEMRSRKRRRKTDREGLRQGGVTGFDERTA